MGTWWRKVQGTAEQYLMTFVEDYNSTRAFFVVFRHDSVEHSDFFQRQVRSRVGATRDRRRAWGSGILFLFLPLLFSSLLWTSW